MLDVDDWLEEQLNMASLVLPTGLNLTTNKTGNSILLGEKHFLIQFSMIHCVFLFL